MNKKSILITGASSGLGHAAARKLADNGFYVFAAVRKICGVFDKIENIEEIQLDVTNEQSVKKSFSYIEARNKDYPLWGVVNNAGVCIPSPLELLRPSELRQHLDINVTGHLLVTQFALPFIRSTKGRIINVTSGLGNVAVPYLGAYSIAQFAKRAFTDVLRRELRHSGVSVSVVQPGKIYTPIWNKFSTAGQAILDQSVDERWKLYEKSFKNFLVANQAEGYPFNLTEDDFAQVILDVLTTNKPAAHYYVGEEEKDFVDKSRTLNVSEIDAWFDLQSPTAEEFKKI
ncbi:SDR family NAD(P)-dependent oxidoreductase [Xenorhabdus bovienii]|uniref:SDR family NAD(P)-dependent oxidoreductase n=1 Tax=Xenorhabdus bovienii TaxID=40576 RepID=UPI00237D05C6|nr:SDR family NAD(P)-dependent oxidoreductase [Xenorhabdus bovienii]MDE1497135.1 SDR family NAD(P)-dependent oxidoreductase [Xenorhabdus bovienii]MDE9475124.1 SDR family NAD(P)-dependent oxidoreductase [Xenorhabdus bovienii]